MKVGLNATCFDDCPSGARQRFLGIYGELIHRRRDIEFVVYEPSNCAVGGWFGNAPNVRAVRTPLPSSSRWRRTLGGLAYWRWRLGKDQLDLFETFHLPLIRAKRCPTVVTIHDARSALPSERSLPRTLARQMLRRALRGASRVITVSATMRGELLAIEPRARISVIYNGIDTKPFSLDAKKRDHSVAQRLGLPGTFILAVGHLEPRKNYARLIEAHAILRSKRPDLALVIVGNDAGEIGYIRRLIEQHALSTSTVLLQSVSDEDLASIYRLSQLVIFPSLYEGFGIPILEAMASHRPIILSDLPVFIELTEGRGRYFPPHDSAAMAGAIAAVLDSPDRQQELVAYGDGRVADFDFGQLSGQVEDVYRDVVKGLAA